MNGPALGPLRGALRYRLKLGFISFDGPTGQIALIRCDLVDDKR